eukprot:COSAG06_NODE_532_length_14551_cov_16.536466_7_plen_36_part_00
MTTSGATKAGMQGLGAHFSGILALPPISHGDDRKR